MSLESRMSALSPEGQARLLQIQKDLKLADNDPFWAVAFATEEAYESLSKATSSLSENLEGIDQKITNAVAQAVRSPETTAALALQVERITVDPLAEKTKLFSQRLVGFLFAVLFFVFGYVTREFTIQLNLVDHWFLDLPAWLFFVGTLTFASFTSAFWLITHWRAKKITRR